MRGEVRKQKSSSGGGVSRSSAKKGNSAAALGVFYVPQSSEAPPEKGPAPKHGKGSGRGGGKGKGKGSREDDEDAENSDSDDGGDVEGSVLSMSGGGTYQEQQFDVTALSECVEGLTDKRPSTRLKSITKLLSLIRGAAAVESIASLQDAYFETLQTSLVRVLARPGSPEEADAAGSVLCLLALITGPHEETFVDRYFPALVSLLEREEMSAPALFALSFITYICSDNSARTLNLVEDILAEGAGSSSLPVDLEDLPDDCRAQAVKSWLLLAGVLEDAEVVSRARERVFCALAEQLDEANVELKLAAGEGLAFLWECAARLAPPDAEALEVAALLCSDATRAAKALAALTQASKESSKHMSKTDKKVQRHAFRAYTSFIVDGEPPGESVRFTGSDYSARSFRELRQLADLRRVLGDCFERALLVYPVVLDLVGIDASALQEGALGGQTRKGSGVEKRRDAHRKQDRRYKGASVGEEDGFDLGDD